MNKQIDFLVRSLVSLAACFSMAFSVGEWQRIQLNSVQSSQQRFVYIIYLTLRAYCCTYSSVGRDDSKAESTSRGSFNARHCKPSPALSQSYDCTVIGTVFYVKKRIVIGTYAVVTLRPEERPGPESRKGQPGAASGSLQKLDELPSR